MVKFNKTSTLILCAFIFVLVMPAAMARDNECSFQQVSDRIYVIVGSDHKTCPIKEVEHPLTNPAIVVGETGIIVIDPGSSLQVGRLVLEHIRTITDKPVVAVFNTHIHGLYWLGNQAIREQFPDAHIYAHERMIKRVRDGEGDFWIDAITGRYQGGKTGYVIPDIALAGGESLTIAGLNIRIHHTGHAHTDHDIMIEIEDENVVFLGGMVVESEVPSQGVPQDANFHGQMAATRYAIDLNAGTYIPGRGNPDGVELPERALRFLTALYRGVQQNYDEGLLDYEITDKLKDELSEYEQWYDFTRLGGVISQMYLQIEAESF